jgi:negative regulator of replication initiation
MHTTRSIDVDFDVHKRLESERLSFAETANDTLRRLLGLGDITHRNGQSPATLGRPWSWKGVELQDGTELRMEYNGRQHVGIVRNGVWLVEGKEYASPSAAASGVAITKDGSSTNLDGWNYWHIKQPGQSHWTWIDKLRTR